MSKASIAEMSKGKGKGSGNDQSGDAEEENGQQVAVAGANAQPDLGPLVVLACRHIYHQSCLESMQVDDAARTDGRDFRCPIDG